MRRPTENVYEGYRGAFGIARRALRIVIAIVLYLTGSAVVAQQQVKVTLDMVLQRYVQALGGQAAVESIRTREIHGTIHGPANTMALLEGNKDALLAKSAKLTCYWEAPDKAMEIRTAVFGNTIEMGMDGTELWIKSPHGTHVRRKPDREMRDELEITTNPLRYAHLKSIYPTILQVATSEELDGKAMDVLTAPNDNGATKFYFDTNSHLLTYVKETGISSTYYPRIIRLRDYKQVDGIEFPFRIAFTSAEPDATTREIKVSTVKHNVEIKADVFTRPIKH